MSRPRRSHWLGATLGCTILACAAVNGHAAEAITDYMARNWFVTEIIVFQRPTVMEMNSGERLITFHPPPLARNIRTFFPTPDQIGAGYELDPQTRADLDYPVTQAPADEDIVAPVVVADSLPEPALDPTTPPLALEPAPEPSPLQMFIEQLARFETDLEARSYRWLADTDYLMTRDARLIEQRGHMQVLLHGRWLQPVPGRDQPEPLFIQAGSKFAERYQLEGTLAVTLGRYLHFQAQLSYQEPGMGQSPIDLPISLTQPQQGARLPAPVPGVMVLNQSRRMRSEEIHYIDHPKLGIIVRIDPVALPDDLVADFESLQESIE